MPEYIRNGFWKKASPGAMLDTRMIRRDLFHLIACFMAEQSRCDVRGQIADIWNEYLPEEIDRCLASTAGLLRARDDYLLRVINETPKEDMSPYLLAMRIMGCGTLCKDVNQGETVPLILREACNKIIHADEYRFDVNGDLEDSFIAPTMYFYGKQGSKSWRAVIDILKYVEIGMRYTEFS